MAGTFIPDDFEIPTRFEGKGFSLEPLGAEHNQRDHLAWMTSIDHIRSTPGFGLQGFTFYKWPLPMSLEKNLDDLIKHSYDFNERVGFTYSILDGEEVIGCLYIYPALDDSYDAEVRSWVRESRSEMDVIVWELVSKWLEDEWPFVNPLYASRGREI